MKLIKENWLIIIIIILLFVVSYIFKQNKTLPECHKFNNYLKEDSIRNLKLDSLEKIIDSLESIQLDTVKIIKEKLIKLEEIKNQNQTEDIKIFNDYLNKVDLVD